MFDKDRFREILAQYKQNFVSMQWDKEKYKWEAIAHFQKYWLDEKKWQEDKKFNFAEMFEKATAKKYTISRMGFLFSVRINIVL